MLTFLLIKICLVYLINATLSEEKNSVNHHIHDNVKQIFNNINLESMDNLSHNNHTSAIFTQNPKAHCNETQKCENGGSCLQHACLCLPGTSGPFCETIDDCKSETLCKRNEYTYCKYSVENQKAYCYCRVMEYRFDDATKTCQSCLCTPTFSQVLSSFSYCEYKQGQQICTCTDGYAYNPTRMICERCNCGPNSTWCEYNNNGRMVCGYPEGFSEYYRDCRECDCGKHGECTLRGIHYKECVCDPGYEEYNLTCVECSCGKYGKCIFDSGGKQIGCNCLPGYAEKSRKCEMCHCGDNSNCSFTGNTKSCECEEGFENTNGFCTDINECEKHNPCEVSTRCVNTLGSYKCICDKGYQRNQETLVCEDIDECKVSTTCSNPNTECINTIGSFKCVCDSDFLTRGGPESRAFCEKSSSKQIYTVSLTVIVLGFVIASVIILHQKTYLRRTYDENFVFTKCN